MRELKVSFIFKIIIFLVNFFLLFNFIVILDYFTLNHLFMFLILGFNFFTYFFILKSRKIWFLGVLILPVLFWIFWYIFIGIIIYFSLVFLESEFFYENFIFYLFWVLAFWGLYYFIYLIVFYLKLRKKDYLDEKYFSKKSQTKSYTIWFLISSILLFVFKFWYYEVEYKIYDIPENYFENKWENFEYKKEENLIDILADINIIWYDYDELKDFDKIFWYDSFDKWCFYDCAFNWKCYADLKTYVNAVRYFKDDKEEFIDDFWKIKTNDNSLLITDEKELIRIRNFLKRNLDIFLKNKDDVEVKKIIEGSKKILNAKISMWTNYYFRNILTFFRELRYQILYLLYQNKEKEALELLKIYPAYYEASYVWNWGLASFIIWMTIESIFTGFIEDILENFELSSDFKNELKQIFSKKKDSYEILKNFWINEYYSLIKEVDIYLKLLFEEYWISNFIKDYKIETVFIREWFLKMEQEEFYSHINENEAQKFLDKYCLWAQWAKKCYTSIFRKNALWLKLFYLSNLSYWERKRDFDEILEKQKIILEKL